MNSLTIIGNLTGDPIHRTTPNGKEVTQFTVAVNRRGKDEADFFRVSAWGELGNNCNRYLNKGKKVAVVGSVSASAYNGQDGKAHGVIEVLAQNVEFLSPKEQEAKPEPKPEKKAEPVYLDVGEGDLPF